MAIRRKVIAFGLVICLLSACSALPASVTLTATQAPSEVPTRVISTATSVKSTETFAASEETQTSTAGHRKITVLYTNDEHGWFAGAAEGQGAANLLGLWRQKEGYDPAGAFLALSGGDNWTGPAVSTWFKGQSAVEVMNAMGYSATAIGNHEFDFGLDVLKNRIAESKYAYVSANLRDKNGAPIPTDLGIKPYVIVNVNGIKVGIIGLTTTLLPELTRPDDRGDFTAINYDQALRQAVPDVKAAGVDMIIVDGHICANEMETLAQEVEDLGIDLISGGHCNDLLAVKVGNTVLIESGTRYEFYGVVTFTYDLAAKRVVDSTYKVNKNVDGPEDKMVAGVVSRWQAKTDAELNVPIGFVKNAIPQKSDDMNRLITGSWLKAFPEADVAITNEGGIRDRLPAGEVTLADIVAVLPFEDVIFEVRLMGSDLLDVVQGGVSSAITGGMHQVGGNWLLDKTGKEIEADAIYTVLINDFMYAGGDNYKVFAQADPNGYNTAISWRQPVIDWIKAQNSSAAHPLDDAIASLGK